MGRWSAIFNLRTAFDEHAWDVWRCIKVLEFASEKRGYRVSIARDLLGDLVLERRWYGLFNRRGGKMVQILPDEDSAYKVIQSIKSARFRNGYKLLPPK